jgi:hypothetical protein
MLLNVVTFFSTIQKVYQSMAELKSSFNLIIYRSSIFISIFYLFVPLEKAMKLMNCIGMSHKIK